MVTVARRGGGCLVLNYKEEQGSFASFKIYAAPPPHIFLWSEGRCDIFRRRPLQWHWGGHQSIPEMAGGGGVSSVPQMATPCHFVLRSKSILILFAQS